KEPLPVNRKNTFITRSWLIAALFASKNAAISDRDQARLFFAAAIGWVPPKTLDNLLDLSRIEPFAGSGITAFRPSRAPGSSFGNGIGGGRVPTDEARTADRIAEQEAQLAALLKER